MFFNKAKRYLLFYYVFYFFSFLILYFMLYRDYGFQSEVYGLGSIFSSYKQVKVLLIPFLIFLYILECFLTVNFLTDYYGKRGSFGYYLFYVVSSVSGLFFYGLAVVAVYYPFKNILTQLKGVSLTELPLLYVYAVMVVVILFLWKIVTYWKIKARINFFGKYPGAKFAVLPLNGFKLGLFVKFLLYLSFAIGFPFVLFVFAVLNKSYGLLIAALFLSFLLFPFNKLFVYHILAEKPKY